MLRKWMLLCIAILALVGAAQAAESDSEKLYAAIRAGDLSGLQTLLEQGASPNARDGRKSPR